ncbi:MAG TPA: hypothetical protein VF070_33900 [Streptosporangiaceae bacterium]
MSSTLPFAATVQARDRSSLERFVDLAVPELQHRGLLHTDYAKGTLPTLDGLPLRAQAGERRMVAMTGFRTHCIPSGLPDLAACSGNSRWPVFDQLAGAVRPSYTDSVVYRPPNLRYLFDTLGAGHVCFGTDCPLSVYADPVGSIVDSPDRTEAGWVREGTASALLSLQ